MTNGWIDIKNTDMMLIMGGNPAENHPCGFKWAIEAKIHRNAKTIVVDPRLTRTAATADMYVQIRAGSDIAFLGGVINYAIQNNRIAHDYLVNYTNAAFIIKDGFKLPDDGLYSGFDPEKQTYDKSTWNYEEGGDLTGKPVMPTSCGTAATRRMRSRQRYARQEKARDIKAASPAGAEGGAAPAPMLPPKIAFDLSLAASTLRLSTSQETVRALHAGDGRAHYRHPARSVPESCRSVHLGPQRRGHEKGLHDHLCRRLDAA